MKVRFMPSGTLIICYHWEGPIQIVGCAGMQASFRLLPVADVLEKK